MKEKKIIDSRYKIEKKIGSGGSSNVYLCTHMMLNMPCAIKIIDKKRSSFIDGKKEAFMLRDLKHEKIPRIIDIIEDDNHLYIIREYCDGINLREYIHHSGPMQYDDLKNISEQIADVLNYFHGKNPPIIYRDLKPENIIIDDEFNIKLIDLGISRRYDKNKEDDTTYIGSQKYAAPEQFGIHQSSIETDVYAFALLLYFLYTAEDFVDITEDEKWRKFSGKKSKKLKNAILKAININIEKRQENISSLIQDAFIHEKNDLPTMKLEQNQKYFLKSNSKMNVAFMGLQSGIGCTHIALSAASFFARLHYQVNLFDISNKGGLEYLHAYNRGYDAFEKSSAKSFKYNDVEVISKNATMPITKMLNLDYDIGIYDFGSSHNILNDFLKMQIKILILPSNPYAIKENLALLQELLQYRDIKFLINLKNTKTNEILNYLNIPKQQGYALGFLDETKLSIEDEDTFLTICQINRKNKEKQHFIKKLFA